MKIVTRLTLLSLTFVVLIVVIGLLTVGTFSRINKEFTESYDANLLIKDVFELNIVTYQYIMHHEKRMQQQWRLKYDSFGKLLDRISRKEAHSECKPILASIMPDYKALGNLFSQLQANFARRKILIDGNRPKIEINMTAALEERLMTQTFMRAQKIVSGAFEVSDTIQKRINRFQQRTNLIVLFSIIGFIALSICISFFAVKSITVPISMLVKGTEIVGTGNLEHKLSTETKDEIGQLSRAFDRMIENLKEITASRNELEREMAERKRVEKALRESERMQGVLEMAGAVCHEMNQPLMAITGYSELISMNISKDDPLYEKISKITEQSDRLGKITQKLMTITKYETKEYLEGKIIDIDKATK